MAPDPPPPALPPNPLVTDVALEGAADVVAWFERRIDSGELRPGARLPTVRGLADQIELAPNTVAAAYRRLVERGSVVTRGRRGSFVADRLAAPAADPGVPEGLADLATGGPDPALLPDLGAVLARLPAPAGDYGSAQLTPAFAAAARRVLAGDGVPVGGLAVMSGAMDAIERVLSVHLRPGDRVAVEAPGWPRTIDLVEALALVPVPVPVDESGPLPAALARVVDQIDAVVVTPRFQNPTGAALDEERAASLREILAGAPDVLVIADDHAGLVAGGALHSVTHGRARWAHVHSIAKSLGPDLRTAIVTGDDDTVTRISARQAVGPGWVSTILQEAVAAILDDPATPALLERARGEYARRRHTLVEACRAAGLEATGRSGFNVWVTVADEQAAVAAAAAVGMAIRAGQRFRLGTPPAVRISVGGLDTDRASALAGALAGSPGSRRHA